MATYTGGCHCGDVKFEVDADLETLVGCNCSICSKMGWRLAFVEEADFRLLEGEGKQTDYQFGKKHIHHLFCTRCGIRSYGYGAKEDGSQMMSVNVRCLDGVDAERLPVQFYDGRSR